jgi:membrane associated rhomboid family serine protease
MVIPVHDSNPVRRTPVVTYALLLANIVVFLISPVSGLNPDYGTGVVRACATDAYFQEYGAIPRELLDNERLPPRPVAVETDQGRVLCPVERFDKVPVLSVLFAMFMHGGWLHLLGNMLFLFVFGNNVEDQMGRFRFLLFYLGVGYLATYAFALVYANSTQTLVGASGAVAGVLGAYLYLYPRAKVTSLVPFLFFIPLRFPAWLVLGFWFVLQWLYFQGAGLAEDAGVAYFAHVAGFVAGFAYAAIALDRPGPERPARRDTSPYPYDPYRRG